MRTSRRRIIDTHRKSGYANDAAFQHAGARDKKDKLQSQGSPFEHAPLQAIPLAPDKIMSTSGFVPDCSCVFHLSRVAGYGFSAHHGCSSSSNLLDKRR